jgi:tryptophan-rich sensory protein
MRAQKRTYFRIGVSVAVCLLIGALSGFATQSSVDTWYPGLAKPSFTPPNWLFAPVWTLLYMLMGIAAGLVWSRGLHHSWVKTALYYFGFQLLVNGSWSLVFFGLQNPQAALWVIGGLLVLIGLTIRSFRVVSRPAAWLMVPYLLWVFFASLLNLRIVQLN